MVLLTMTPAIVEALDKIQRLEKNTNEEDAAEKPSTRLKAQGAEVGTIDDKTNDSAASQSPDGTGRDKLSSEQNSEPSLTRPKVGSPISHGQVVDLWRQLKARKLSPSNLDTLIRGARVYTSPPKPKSEPTSEYKALMARLRRDEEERSYQRLTNPTPPMETFAQRFPHSSAAHAFASSQQPINADDDEVTYADVDRQMALILNVLVSILACAAAIWIAAKWWSTPARFALSFCGSLLVGVAEVVVYAGYIRRVGEAKVKEKGIKEFKEVLHTWVVGGDEDGVEPDGVEKSITLESKDDHSMPRRRK